jgi:hypothetical protein
MIDRPPMTYTGKLADFECQVLEHPDHYTVFQFLGRGKRTKSRHDTREGARARARVLGTTNDGVRRARQPRGAGKG